MFCMTTDFRYSEYVFLLYFIIHNFAIILIRITTDVTWPIVECVFSLNKQSITCMRSCTSSIYPDKSSNHLIICQLISILIDTFRFVSMDMALNIFSSIPVWSRSKPSDSRIGEVKLLNQQIIVISSFLKIQCMDISNDSAPMSTSFASRINDLYIGTTDG